METSTTKRIRKPKVCKKCERYAGEITKREGLLEGRDIQAAGLVSTRILLDKYKRLLREHMDSQHWGLG